MSSTVEGVCDVNTRDDVTESEHSCCCKGDSCNVPHIPIKQIVNDQDDASQSTSPANHISTSKIGVLAWISNNPTLFFAIALPLLLLVLLILIFTFLLCRRCKASAHPLGSFAVGGSSKFSTDKHKPFLCLKPFPSFLRFCFSTGRSKDDEHQFCASGNTGCRSCPLNGTPCVFCGNGFLSQVDGSPSMPQLVRPALGGGWLAEGEIEELSRICTKVKRCSRGRFGEVWLGRMNEVVSGRAASREVAIKVFPEAEKKSWETELELYRLPRLKHPNVLHYIGVDKVTRVLSEEGERDRSGGVGEGSPVVEYWLVTDYLAFGSVYDYIHNRELSWGQMLWIAMGMARGLSYLHTELPRTVSQYPKPSIAHRDFKSRNVLLKPDLTPCISDLGLATRLETGRGFGDAHLQVGTARYMAPEVLDGAIQFTRDAFLRIDVYALGLVIWELMTRAHGPGAAPPDDNAPSRLPPYMAPFEAEVGPIPTMEKLQHYVAKLKNRPRPCSWWERDQAFMQLWETVQDSWDHDAEARITAGCIAGRIQNLSQRYPPSSDDPASLMPFLASTSSIHASDSSSASSSLEVIEINPVASEPSPDAVPLLASSPVPHPDASTTATVGPVTPAEHQAAFVDVWCAFAPLPWHAFLALVHIPTAAGFQDENTATVGGTKGDGEEMGTRLGEDEITVGSLRSEALRRKERLINLRRQAQKMDPYTTGRTLGREEELPKPIFRNYKPISGELKAGQLPEGPMIDLDAHVAEQLEAAKAQSVVDEVNLFNLAPRKPDWDLKRGVEKKLKKLERRTQRVIAELIRERLRESENSAATTEIPSEL
ncbi:Activin receptor type-2A [Taenia crassiceps]|uniref:receptor protein serine/threonine kinase n=1 Tax=Taenia crassiceps TaxID=6207 RepID=A0ABR4QMY5_9CEST